MTMQSACRNTNPHMAHIYSAPGPFRCPGVQAPAPTPAPATPTASDGMLAKIRALLAKAEDPATTEAEAEAYNTKAAELLAKYGVDRAMLASTDATTDAVGDVVIQVPAPYALDKCGLLSGIAYALRCRTVRRKRWTGDAYAFEIHLFGFQSDLERVDMLYTSLLIQASGGMARAYVPYGDSAAAFRRSWLMGFTHTVSRRLVAAETAAEANAKAGTPTTVDGGAAPSGPSVALVLASRTDEVDRTMADAYPKLGKSRARKLAGSGYGEGREAGRRADLGGRRIGNGAGSSRAVTR